MTISKDTKKFKYGYISNPNNGKISYPQAWVASNTWKKEQDGRKGSHGARRRSFTPKSCLDPCPL